MSVDESGKEHCRRSRRRRQWDRQIKSRCGYYHHRLLLRS